MNVNMKLKIKRVENNWSQSDLAERANVSRGLISQIENGRSIDNVDLGILKKTSLSTKLNSTRIILEWGISI